MMAPWTKLVAACAAFSLFVGAWAQTTPPPATTPPATPPVAPQQQPPAQNDTVTAEQKKEVLDRIQEILNTRVYVTGVDLSKWPEFVAKHQENIDKAENTRAFSMAVNRAFREFGFSHINLRTPRAATQRRTGPVGTGFGVQAEKEGDGLVVRAVFPESPAARAGLQVGDVILEVDGKQPESAAVLSGEGAPASKIKVRRKSGETQEIELQRGQFSTARQDTLRWVDEESAVLKIHSFSNGYSQRRIEELVKEASTKAKFLVLDLRSNGGGATTNLRHLLSLLLPDDTEIGAFISKEDAAAFEKKAGRAATNPQEIAASKERKYRTFKARVEPFQGRIAVLTNRGSASASEIVAAALREQAGSPLVGTRTAGAVLASVYGRLPHGFELQYPITDYVTFKGIRLEGNPLVPDAEVTGRPDGDKDPVVEKAIELLRAKGR